MLPRTALIKIQRSMYDKLKEHASSMFGGLQPELKQYFKQYSKENQKYSALSTKRELLLEVLKGQVIFLGDYHTLAQAQRTVIRILRDSIRVLKRKNRRVFLALEMLTPHHDVWVKKFLLGKLSEKEFLKRIGFQANWGFPWEHYKALFEFARDHQIDIKGINHPGGAIRPNLKKRDQFAAKVITEITVKDPNAIVFVLIGDLHLAEKHLPQEFRSLLKKQKAKRRTVIVHQNVEPIYWKLVERGLESFVDVVQIKKNIFCVMNTPPWVKLKSHLNWTELMAQTGGIPPLESAAQAFEEMDYSDEVQDLTSVIGKFLGILLPKLEGFQIFGPLDLEILSQDASDESDDQKVSLSLDLKYAKLFKSHFIPRKNIICLNSLSLNHVAAQSSIYLHSELSGFSSTFENPKSDFYRFVWVEAIGFLGAKIINPKRKCNGRVDLKKHLTSKPTKYQDENTESAKLALWHLNWEMASRPSNVVLFLPESPQKNTLYYKTAKILGHLLGHAIYQAIVDMKISPSEVSPLFFKKFETAQQAFDLYVEWGERLDRFNYRESVKWERL